jgi:AcrR family transcriptional regulator
MARFIRILDAKARVLDHLGGFHHRAELVPRPLSGTSQLDLFVCISYKQIEEAMMTPDFACDPAAADPKHAVRATRTAGRKMRSLLLDAASRLFKERGLSGTSITDIAAAADAFPSQITYYFRTKEALFVETACRDMLYLARATEQAGLKAHTPREYTRALAETVTATDSVAFFAEALTLTRRRQDLAPLVERTIERLHSEGARAYASQVERHGWRSLRAPQESSRRFWAVAIGVIVEGFAMGRAAEDMRAELLRALGEQATATSTNDGTRLRLVGEADGKTSSHGETAS